ncbi:hypothetical protein LOK49_LG13G00031 [Camellia lanceoleosa]|uniref:Uncharacterized protein n=1 Tax=Camellia lanceoleosa TaxID=1840588 RepID=A0ACC0FJ64_9ERIC|nr:hypothetical protein LOK49_LG13G00031 [Camellia lanceoleosa]
MSSRKQFADNDGSDRDPVLKFLELILFPVTDPFCRLPCLHCSIDLQVAHLGDRCVMSTSGHGRHAVLRIFKGRWGRTGHHASYGALPLADLYLLPSRFCGGQAVKQKR